jgi:heme exporter protein C
MFNYLKPNNLLKIIKKTKKFLFFIFLLIISIGLVEALILSPED